MSTLKIVPDVITEFEPTADIQPLPDEVIQRCIELLYRIRYEEDPMRAWETFPWFDITVGLNWKWTAPGGTILKRIQKWYYKQFGTNLKDVTLETLHEIIRSKVPKFKKHYIEFTQDLNWRDGDYGDSGACFFYGRSVIRDEMQKDGRFWAVRFYKAGAYGARKACADGTCVAGYARALFALEEIKINKKLSLPYIVVFNGHTLPTDKVAQILSAYFQMPYKWMNATNNRITTGGLYVNDGGYIIASQKALDGIDTYDFGLKTKYKSYAEFENTIENTVGREVGDVKNRNICFFKNNIVRVNSYGEPIKQKVLKIKSKRNMFDTLTTHAELIYEEDRWQGFRGGIRGVFRI